jgi:hypothetical protein
MALVSAMPTAVGAIKIMPSEMRNLRFDCPGTGSIASNWFFLLVPGSGQTQESSEQAETAGSSERAMSRSSSRIRLAVTHHEPLS